MADFVPAAGMSAPAAVGNGTGPIVLAAAATGIVDHIRDSGGDIDLIFGRTGIAPSMAGSPTLKLPLSAFCRLFEQASKQSHNDNFGLWFGNGFKPRDLGLWGYAAVSSPTVGSAIENLVNLFGYHQESSQLALNRAEDGLMRLEYQIVAPEIVERRQDAELSLGMFLNVIREGTSRTWAPEEVHFEHPKPENWHDHETAFSAPVYFSQPTNAILFRDDVLDRPMPGRDLKLMTMMQTCLERLGSDQSEPDRLIDLVRSAIRTHLPHGYPCLEDVASGLEVTPGTIQRELAHEGVAYKDLVEGIRRDLAIVYLRQRQLPLSEVAYLLGYSELSALSRAVRRWTGESPRTVRASLTGA